MVKYEISTAGLNAIFFSSTICNISGIKFVNLIYLLICSLLSPTSSANCSLVLNFSTNGVEVKSVLLPCLPIASIFILYANAFSLGKISSLCRLLSTIRIVASSSVNSLTIHGISPISANSTALFLLCPDTISNLLSFVGLTIIGFNTPFSFILSTKFSICSSSLTLNG